MGAYLSTPVRDKESKDYDGDFLSFGASSMQGWRMTQEDAHSCQVDFDKENHTSLFAVYDGHGGAEVAQYSSMQFPKFLKKVTNYEKGLVKEALEEAFLGFDATLTEETVVQQLKDLAGLEKDSSEADEEAKNEAAALCEEASMPLEKVLERYKGAPVGGGLVNKTVNSLRKRQKFQSPLVKTKAVTQDACGSGNSGEGSGSDSEPTSSSKDDQDDLKVKLEDKLTNGFCEKKNSAPEQESDVADNSTENVKSNVSESITNSKEENLEPGSDAEVCNSTQSVVEKTDAGNSEHQLCQSSTESNELPDENQTSSKQEACCPTSSSIESAEPSNSSSSEAVGSSVDDKNEDKSEEEEDTDDEEVDSEDDDVWNSAEMDCDSDDDEDDDTDGFEVDDDDDDEDEEEDEDNDEEGGTMGWSDEPGADSGCTAVVALLKGRELYVANAGDSRCVLCRNGKAVDMSNDHKPEDVPEQQRIVKAGGRVTCDGRVNGGLNLSRALGDHSYKKNSTLDAREQMITALPDVKNVRLTDEDTFMVLACDGIWNVMNSQDVVDFVQRRLDDGITKLSAICEEMFDFCLAPDTTGDGTGCDNMTCVIVRFNKLHEESKKRPADEDNESEDCHALKRVRQTDEDDSKDL